ncbi:MAG: phosphodiesterase [Ruminobacter sp.]|jgi:hypothetical protein|nr:phosphodiesterase [Ruminobacter sp.]MBR1923782.1 phosphodiesterase [Ruminobacter sp.]
MTTYAVISDVHGNAENLEKAIKVADTNRADFLIFLGDFLNHGPRNGLPSSYDPMYIVKLLNSLKERIIAVRGNCDSEVDSTVLEFPIDASYNTLIINGRKAFMTHGHRYDETDSEYIGLANGDIFMSGHTHCPVLKQNRAGIYILNPGSITFPRGGSDKSMAIINEQGISLRDLTNGVTAELTF